MRVEKQASAEWRCGAGLSEPVTVPWQFGKDPEEFLPVIVIADQEMKRHLETPDLGAEDFIAGDVPRIRQVARHDHKVRVTVFCIDGVNRRAQPFCRIETGQRAIACDNVGVGEMNDLHETPPPEQFPA